MWLDALTLPAKLAASALAAIRICARVGHIGAGLSPVALLGDSTMADSLTPASGAP
jgi:hypothetical protein